MTSAPCIVASNCACVFFNSARICRVGLTKTAHKAWSEEKGGDTFTNSSTSVQVPNQPWITPSASRKGSAFPSIQRHSPSCRRHRYSTCRRTESVQHSLMEVNLTDRVGLAGFKTVTPLSNGSRHIIFVEGALPTQTQRLLGFKPSVLIPRPIEEIVRSQRSSRPNKMGYMINNLRMAQSVQPGRKVERNLNSRA